MCGLFDAVLRRALVLVCFVSCGAVSLVADDTARELIGVWEATRRFGPEVRGELTLSRAGRGWQAEIGGYTVPATVGDEAVVFELPGGRGRFRGRSASGDRLVGHWIQPRTRHGGLEVASPVLLRKIDGRWRGEVVPFEDDFTFYIVARARDDGSVGAFLRNPERNFGIILNVDRLERNGDRVQLIGSFFRNTDATVLADGSYSPGSDMMTFTLRGASFDFRRVVEDPGSHFFARGSHPEPYRYRRPTPESDGWPVGSLEEVGIEFEPLRDLIRTEVDPPADSVHDLYIHAMLIARHGKLVFEDYFHGFDRLTPHDTRSASKSATSVLVGAVMQADASVDLSSPVFETIYGNALPADLDERKLRMTVEHLLTMSAGFDCDDSDPESRGSEDVMQSQEDNRDWYDYTLANPMVREPGEQAVYCSASSNLLGRVLSRGTGERLEELFHRLIAEPLGIRRYHLILQPTGEPYLGGGIQWLPRDFMKLGQLMLNGGSWNGRRVLGEEYAARAISPLYEMRQRYYGYQWWQKDYPYRDGTVRAFYAGGNGGQVVIGIPELDLLVTFFAGNYSDVVLYRIQDELVPQYILPAVDAAGR